jgi:hypothetical protein
MHFRRQKGQRNDYMLVVENVDGHKVHKIVPNPTIKLFMTKEKYWTDDPPNDPVEMFVPLNTVDEVEWPFKDNLKSLHMYFPDEWEYAYNACIEGRDWDGLRRVYRDNRIHGADVHIEDHYMGKYLDHYTNSKNDILVPSPILHKAYWDIEVKVEELPPGMTIDESIREAPAPIDAISLYSDAYDIMYTFLLIVPDNPLMMEFQKNVEKYREQAIKRFNIYDCRIMFFENDVDLINEFFHTVNQDLKPDFLSAWNQGYDFRMTHNRLKKLRYNPEDFFCADDIPHKKVFYWEDTRNWDPAKKGDYAEVSGYTNYCDQMLTFASLRATMGKRDSYALDAIAKEELDDSKDPVPVSFREFARWDYAKYVLYNQQDVHLLHRLEKKNQDIELIYQLGMITRTRPHKAWKKTISLRNLAIKFMYDRGYVCSNNHNMYTQKNYEGKFEGAFVADPSLNAHNGIELFGNKSNFLFENVCDEDLTSLYPSIILLQMIDPTNQLGRIDLRDKNGRDLAPQLIRDFANRDFIKLGERWFNMPGKDKLIEKILQGA